MNDCAQTPMSDHVAEFWRLLETETVRIVLDLKRDGYWDGSTFSDDVAKALVSEHREAASRLSHAGTPGPEEQQALENFDRVSDSFFEATSRALDGKQGAVEVKATCPVLSEELVEQAWCDFFNVDDRTSPEEHPDMALIKFDELREIIARFAALSPSDALREEVERLRKGRDEWRENATTFKGLCEEWEGVAEAEKTARQAAEVQRDAALKALEEEREKTK